MCLDFPSRNISRLSHTGFGHSGWIFTSEASLQGSLISFHCWPLLHIFAFKFTIHLLQMRCSLTYFPQIQYTNTAVYDLTTSLSASVDIRTLHLWHGLPASDVFSLCMLSVRRSSTSQRHDASWSKILTATTSCLDSLYYSCRVCLCDVWLRADCWRQEGLFTTDIHMCFIQYVDCVHIRYTGAAFPFLFLLPKYSLDECIIVISTL